MLRLNEFGAHVEAALRPGPEWKGYGVGVYQVGSSIDPDRKRDWYDVDVVAILDDELWKAMGFREDPDESDTRDEKWIALCSAFCALGAQLTGLKIDFKIQPQTWANAKHKGKPRSAIGFVPHRFVD